MFCEYAGEVGEGCGAELGDIWGPPVIVAVRCDDAASAAAEGSNEELSSSVRPSWIVGEGFFGAELRTNFFVESLRCMLGPPDPEFKLGGDVTCCSWGVGSGCWLSLTIRTRGRSSSRSFRFSSKTRFKSSFKCRSSDSATCIRSSRV